MQKYIEVKNNLNLTLWKSSLFTNRIFRVKLSNYPIFNNPFPVQGFVEALTPGYNYYPDSTYFDIQIDPNGTINIPLRHSISFDNNTITWSNGEVWNKITSIPRNTQINYLDQNRIDVISKQDTLALYEKMNSIYGQHPIVKGQKVPT